jgi:hypothetical protein
MSSVGFARRFDVRGEDFLRCCGSKGLNERDVMLELIVSFIRSYGVQCLLVFQLDVWIGHGRGRSFK